MTIWPSYINYPIVYPIIQPGFQPEPQRLQREPRWRQASSLWLQESPQREAERLRSPVRSWERLLWSFWEVLCSR